MVGLLLPSLVSSLPRPEEQVYLWNVVVVGERCTGFVAYPSVVVTAAHCIIEESPTQTVRFVDGASYNFKLYEMGKPDHTDYAVLIGDTRGIEPWKLAEGTPAFGEPCGFAGYGAIRPSQYLNFCSVNPVLSDWTGYINIAAFVIGGDSGSPVFDMNGKVFGIMVRGSRGFPQGLAVPIELVKAAYRRYLAP